jgi:hypothetical protein
MAGTQAEKKLAGGKEDTVRHSVRRRMTGRRSKYLNCRLAGIQA